MTWFVDTNVIVRAVVGDDASKSRAASELLLAADRGETELETNATIVAEAVYVLSSTRQYGMARSAIVSTLMPIIASSGLHIEEKPVILAALRRYERARLDFEDCLAVEHASSRGLEGIYSYDRGFDAIEAVARREP